jgi:hypothetical protein
MRTRALLLQILVISVTIAAVISLVLGAAPWSGQAPRLWVSGLPPALVVGFIGQLICARIEKKAARG